MIEYKKLCDYIKKSKRPIGKKVLCKELFWGSVIAIGFLYTRNKKQYCDYMAFSSRINKTPSQIFREVVKKYRKQRKP